MSLTGGLVSFVVIWWLVFFMALPFGVHPPETIEAGHDLGAPENPRIWLKVAITTVIAAVLTVGLYYFLESGLIDLRPEFNPA